MDIPSRTLGLDPDGAFRSHEIEAFCDKQHIHLDVIPGEAHWKLGVCENSIQAVKHMLSAIVEDQPDIAGPDALAESIRVLNSRDVVRGYSPVQHVLGRAPDELGRFFTTVENPCPELVSEAPAQGHEREHQMRLVAEKSLLEWNAQQRLTRATNSSHRRVMDFQAGELVYIWRRQLTGKRRTAEQGRRRPFCGSSPDFGYPNNIEMPKASSSVEARSGSSEAGGCSNAARSSFDELQKEK